MLLLGKWPEESIDISETFSILLFVAAVLVSSPESHMCIRKSRRSRRCASFLYLTVCPKPVLNSEYEKTQFQPLKNSKVRWGHTHVLSVM